MSKVNADRRIVYTSQVQMHYPVPMTIIPGPSLCLFIALVMVNTSFPLPGLLLARRVARMPTKEGEIFSKYSFYTISHHALALRSCSYLADVRVTGTNLTQTRPICLHFSNIIIIIQAVS